jgi:hypothetical protein
MSDPRAFRIRKFREKHERQLLSMAAQAVCIAGCLNDGNAALLDKEMDYFAGLIFDLSEQERKTRKYTQKEDSSSETVVALKKTSP